MELASTLPDRREGGGAKQTTTETYRGPESLRAEYGREAHGEAEAQAWRGGRKWDGRPGAKRGPGPLIIRARSHSGMRYLSFIRCRHEGCGRPARCASWAAARLWLAGLALGALVLGGCAASGARGDLANGAKAAALSPEQCLSNGAVQAAALGRAAADPRSYRIQPGDELEVDFYLDPEFNDQVSVGPDGKIALRMVGALPAAGMTPMQLAQEVDTAYSSELRSPDAVVNVKNMPARQIYVEGQVTRPGAFPLQPGMTALQALADAGGVTPDAADDSVVLIRRDACGQPTGERIDLASAADGSAGADDVGLMPYDILVVPRSRIANMDLFVQHYIRGLLPMEPYLSFPGPAL